MDTAARVAPAPPVRPAPRPAPRPLAGAPAVAGRTRRAEAWTLLRFAAAGLSGNAAHAAVFLAAAALPAAVAHVLATALSTLVTTELHRRFTFRAAARTPWYRGHGTGGAAAAAGLAASTGALLAQQHLFPLAGHLAALLVVQLTTAAVGTVNFLLLRAVLRTPVGELPGARFGGVAVRRSS
ncbi:GtrA family protein [Kineococcus gypseus]|uniref:GtrA family protein n=1 Tax=Kineococcus gypseus TaxID=1637102 RepID=UPI003D7E76EF